MPSTRGYPVRVGRHPLRLSVHAIERYGERVRPGLDRDGLITELRRVLEGAEFGAEKPEWASSPPLDTRGWVRLTDDIVFPVVGNLLVTCLDRGGIGAQVRIVKAEDRRQHSRRDPGRRTKHGKVKRAERQRARARREEAVGE